MYLGYFPSDFGRIFLRLYIYIYWVSHLLKYPRVTFRIVRKSARTNRAINRAVVTVTTIYLPQIFNTTNIIYKRIPPR